jgi:hypothetical protein
MVRRVGRTAVAMLLTGTTVADVSSDGVKGRRGGEKSRRRGRGKSERREQLQPRRVGCDGVLTIGDRS